MAKDIRLLEIKASSQTAMAAEISDYRIDIDTTSVSEALRQLALYAVPLSLLEFDVFLLTLCFC